MARPPRDPSLLSWPWGSTPSGSGGPSSAVGLTSLPIVNSHAESAAMLFLFLFFHFLFLDFPFVFLSLKNVSSFFILFLFFSFLGCPKSVAALQDSLGKSAHSELALFALYWLVVTFPFGIVHNLEMIRLRVVFGGRRVGQVRPSYQNRQISALDVTADAPQSCLFSLLSSLTLSFRSLISSSLSPFSVVVVAFSVLCCRCCSCCVCYSLVTSRACELAITMMMMIFL